MTLLSICRYIVLAYNIFIVFNRIKANVKLKGVDCVDFIMHIWKNIHFWTKLFEMIFVHVHFLFMWITTVAWAETEFIWLEFCNYTVNVPNSHTSLTAVLLHYCVSYINSTIMSSNRKWGISLNTLWSFSMNSEKYLVIWFETLFNTVVIWFFLLFIQLQYSVIWQNYWCAICCCLICRSMWTWTTHICVDIWKLKASLKNFQHWQHFLMAKLSAQGFHFWRENGTQMKTSTESTG